MSRVQTAASLVATVSIDGTRLRDVLRAEGFEPPDNICVSCGHSGGDHDLGNWCLLCPRPDDWDRRAPSPTGAKVRAGWCFFGSMTEDERWDRSMARIVAALRPTQGGSEMSETPKCPAWCYLHPWDMPATPPVPAGDEREDVDWIADVQRRFGLGPEASTADVWRAHEAMIEEAEAEGYERGVRLTEGGNK